jgi:hypothetical protein
MTGIVEKPAEEIVSDASEGEQDWSEEEPTEAQPVRASGGDPVDGGDAVVTVGMLAQLLFLKPVGLGSAGGATGARAVVLDAAFAILTPAAAAILRSSFSSRFRSFSLRLSCSSGVFCLARWVFCISRKRIL